MPKDNSPSAFPYNDERTEEGMSLRDHYAGLAMQAGISVLLHDNATLGTVFGNDCNRQKLMDVIAETAFIQADAMIRARSK